LIILKELFLGSSGGTVRGSGRLGNRVGYELKRVQHDLRHGMDEALKGLGVTTPQYAALSVLAEEPGLSNAGLARRSFVTPQTMNQILVRLEAAGLVERRPHPEHGRVLQARLTEEGEKLRRECAKRVDVIEERMVRGLSEEERLGLLEMLRRCSEALRQDGG
jgi:DNA-binding MarR family transcriptional regulator